jgi:hypothetical protein
MSVPASPTTPSPDVADLQGKQQIGLFQILVLTVVITSTVLLLGGIAFYSLWINGASQRLTEQAEAPHQAPAQPQPTTAVESTVAEEATRQEEQEKLYREQGEPIDYDVFYARLKSTGVPADKRYRISAYTNELLNVSSNVTNTGKGLQGYARFDDEAQHQMFLMDASIVMEFHKMVVSVGEDGDLHIHRIE